MDFLVKFLMNLLGLGRKELVMEKEVIESLRKLMYLKEIKGDTFSTLEVRAVKSFELDLEVNPLLVDYRVEGDFLVEGKPTVLLRDTLRKILEDPNVGVLTSIPKEEVEEKNEAIRSKLSSVFSSLYPVPLAMAVLKQETWLRWYRKDGYPLVGLDYNDKNNPDRITSRGLFLSQRTIFKEITSQELEDYGNFVTDINFLLNHLRGKFDNFIVSSDISARDDIRFTYFGNEPLRECVYSGDGCMSKCKECVESLPKVDYLEGHPFIPPSRWRLKATQYHRDSEYKNVPDLSKLPCDFLYAIRRYNGSGINSVHYLIKTLKHLMS